MKKQKFTIEELVKNPNFEVKFISKGGHSGKCVGLEIKSKFHKNIEVLIPEGTLFYPANEKEQTLITPIQEVLAIGKNRIVEYTLNGYCTESSDRSPVKLGAFKLGKNKNEKLSKLLVAFKKNKNLKNGVIQEAIWCVTNNNSVGNIYSDDPKDVIELKKAVSEITGLKIPWQSTKRNLVTNTDGYIVAEPVKITGKVIFSTEKPTKLSGKIINSENVEVYKLQDSTSIPKVTNARMKFNVSVKGWDKGKYFVIYTTSEGKEIVKQEFEV